MKVLVIYPEVPDAQRLFVLENATEEELNILNIANGHFVNGVDMTKEQDVATEWIAAAVTNPKHKEDYYNPSLIDVVGRWNLSEINSDDLPRVTGIDKVFITGFYL